MIDDWLRLGAVAGMICAAGAFGVVEATMNKRRKTPGGGYASPRGGIRWLLVIFAIDALVTFFVYSFLDAALSDEFFGHPVLVYLVAFAASPLILRFQVEFALPAGPRAQDLMSVIPNSRRFMSDLVGTSSARYRAKWVGGKAVPTIGSRRLQQLCEHATTFFANATHLSEPTRSQQMDLLKQYRSDRKATADQRIRSTCQSMIDYGGLGSLKDFLKLIK